MAVCLRNVCGLSRRPWHLLWQRDGDTGTGPCPWRACLDRFNRAGPSLSSETFPARILGHTEALGPGRGWKCWGSPSLVRPAPRTGPSQPAPLHQPAGNAEHIHHFYFLLGSLHDIPAPQARPFELRGLIHGLTEVGAWREADAGASPSPKPPHRPLVMGPSRVPPPSVSRQEQAAFTLKLGSGWRRSSSDPFS